MSQIQRIDNRAAEVNEESSLLITGTLTDQTGTIIPASALDSATLTLYDEDTDTVINNRNDVNILASMDEDGGLELLLHPEDNAIVTEGDSGTSERHIALLHFTWDTHPEGMWREILIDVRRLHRVGEE